MALFGGVEGGGTKFVCAVGTGPDDIRAETRFPTTTPDETLRKAIAFFKEQENQHGKLSAIGMGSFGPIDPRSGSPTYGHIMLTPKPGWSNADMVGPLQAAFGIPIGFDLDVNAAALAEFRWGAAQGCDPALYMTIGTGIGGGVIANGKLLHGLLHPEMGHIHLIHDLSIDPFPGVCPFHKDCFEGLAAGPALEKRWGKRASNLPFEHPAWDLEAGYIAQALTAFIYTLSPQKIILGGGVMQQIHLFEHIRKNVQVNLNSYVQSKQILENIDEYIVPPGLSGYAGVLGALALAEQALKDGTNN
jgi:fructokinase